MSREPSPPTVISLFSGAGGLDLGFEAAGYRVAAAVEWDSDCVTTMRANRGDRWAILESDIHDVNSADLLAEAGLSEAEPDVLIGGPPCQPFSKSGYWASRGTLRLDDPRAGTLEGYLRVLRDTLPRAFLLENVEGLLYRNKDEALELLNRTVHGINRQRGVAYSFHVAKLSAAAFGVPQLRDRVFIIGARDGSSFAFPSPRFHPPGELDFFGEARPYRTAWDAIGDLEEAGEDDPELAPRGKWADLLPAVPEGENYLYHTPRGGGRPLFGWRRRYWSFLLKLAKSHPSWTIQAQPGPATGPFHWRSRRLSARELCRIQTIPDSYAIIGDLRSAQRQLGNAVPSALGEVLAREIRRQILGHEVSQEPILVTPYRGEPPLPEPVSGVPEKYRYLEGKHPDHPGVGKGYAFSARP